MTRLLAVAALLAPAPLCAADAPAPGVPVVGVGLVSADHKTIFLPEKDGVEAVDMASGRSLWKNKAATRLAGVSDKRLIAWLGDEKKPNTFRVVVFDTETGRPLVKSDPIEMPDWAATAKAGGRSFRAAATADGESVMVIWEAKAFYYGGAPPTPRVEAAAKKDAGAVVTVDLKSGKVKPVDRKPTETDFKLSPAGGAANNKLAEYEFRVDEQEPKSGMPGVTKVTFTVLKGGKEFWSRELVGNPWSPPPP